MRGQFRTRIRVVLALIVFISICIIARLYFVQIVHGEEYSLKADRQFSSSASGLFDRGSIFFKRKDGVLISAATLSTGFLLAINPQEIGDGESAWNKIDSIIPNQLDHDTFISLSGKKSQVYIEVAHRLPSDVGRTISALEIPGVHVLRERWRYYPGKTLAAPTIGIVSYGGGDELSGQTGLEAVYNETLSRSSDSLYKNFFAELFSSVGNLLVNARESREGSLVTTIEPEVQTRLADNVAKLSEKYSSKESGGIIMDPSNGRIIALSTYPSYDSNNRQSLNPSLLGNPLVEHVYEFGSIMKPLTMTSGLDSGVITPTSTYKDQGCITVDTARICNWDLKARGTVEMKQIIMQSLNLGAAWVATELGPDKFRSYFERLFGDRTGIDLPAETTALLGNLNSPRQIEYDNMAFGQGIAVTPIQMIRALGAIANHGVMVTPHIVESITYKTGISKNLEWNAKSQVFSPEAARDTTSMMSELYDDILYNGKAKIPTMTVAAKTGTAQLTKSGGGYYPDRYFHSFVGFFPAYNPRFIILLYTNDPKGVTFASETLDPTFIDLVHFLIEYYAVPPDRGVPVASDTTSV